MNKENKTNSMTDTTSHADYCNGNHITGKYLCEDERTSKLRKGICIECDDNLDFNSEYEYAYCDECGYKIGVRELKVLQKL